MTVLFSDVADFTSISEDLDPEEVHQVMDGCFKIIMDEIHKYEGLINQFTGDGVMALFGAPVAHEDHAHRACYAALSIQKVIERYSLDLRRKYDIDFKMRMGLNSGPVVVGSIGDDLRFELLKVSAIGTRIEAASVKGLSPFVGRKNSMTTLMEAYYKARSGLGQVVGVVGEAGLGKSRLLLEFRNRLSQDEITYIEGQCLSYGDSIAYLPLVDILRAYFQIREDENEFVVKQKM